LRAELLDPWQASRIADQIAGMSTPQPWALPIGEQTGRFDAADLGAGGALSCLGSATRTKGAGSIASDAPSLAAWMWHLFAGDILAPASLQTMVPSAGVFAYGLERAPYGDGSIGSSGNKTGYGAQVTMFPESRAIVVVFVNDPRFAVESTTMALLGAAAAR